MMPGILIPAPMAGTVALHAMRQAWERLFRSGQAFQPRTWSPVATPKPSPLTPIMAPLLGCLPRKRFDSLHVGQDERAAIVLWASAACNPAITPSPTHHTQSLYQCRGHTFVRSGQGLCRGLRL